MTPASDPLIRILAGEEEARFLNSFFVLYKNARLLERNSATFQNQTTGFYDQLSELAGRHGDVALKIISGRYFINEFMVRFDDRGLSGAESVVKEWKKLGLGGVRFAENISKDRVVEFFDFLSEVRPASDNLSSLSERLKASKLDGIDLLSLEELEIDRPVIPEHVRRQFRVAARKTFFKAMSVVQEAIAGAAADKEINVSKTKRVVHSLIDHIMRDESSLVELTAIKDFDDYTYAHSTNVCVYALTLGVRLGLDRSRLSQLGFAALFHDVGKVKLPADLIRKPGSFDENDWLQMQRHPFLGAKTILRNMKLDEHTARGARGAFEHHINDDFTGYPVLKNDQRQTNLFSKILAIVDTFDALTSGRLYIKKAIPADEVLRKMHYQMTVKFDPFLLRIFTGVVGVYPAGSLVLLESEEIALVLAANENDPSRPYVKIVGNRSGLLEDPIWADLSQDENANREIMRMIDPSRYGLDVKDFVLKD